MIFIRGSTCLKAEDSEMYYASALLREISVCKDMHQNTGQLAYMTTITVRDMK